ncbi:hypothetical protein NIES22_05430 [Calothrix brevissima NIES-22]|nr:hypothetical protein NIES22_05430 [Calothrix brevissima NIES-22]
MDLSNTVLIIPVYLHHFIDKYVYLTTTKLCLYDFFIKKTHSIFFGFRQFLIMFSTYYLVIYKLFYG